MTERSKAGSDAAIGDRQFYGRRKGHTLRPRQQERLAVRLPELRLDLQGSPPTSLSALFPVPVNEFWLEVGFGGGEHLIHQAVSNPGVGLLGAEPFINGLSRMVQQLDAAGARNVRIHDDDARFLLKWLPPESISRAFILYPDPWPKRRHHRRRFVSAENLALLARVMKPGASLTVATDIPDYVRTTLIAIFSEGSFRWTAEVPEDWRKKNPDWPETRYEEKAKAAGRVSAYLVFERQ